MHVIYMIYTYHRSDVHDIVIDCVHIYIYIYIIHVHTHVYIYIYILYANIIRSCLISIRTPPIESLGIGADFGRRSWTVWC